ncbi:MAG: hypothetical protein ACODTU_20430 [Pigmentiphaga sp.]|uniref:hypothetical protein n=1 Tax=Pigmentiphaga sp. TaxID=1977564 RepID=UPI003B5699E6
MAWPLPHPSRYQLIAELIAPRENERVRRDILAHALRDNVLWSVAQVTAKTEAAYRGLAPGQSLRSIRCHLLECVGNRWGCKALDESMHPPYYTCPLSFLDLVPEQCAEWRAGVRVHHAQQRGA